MPRPPGGVLAVDDDEGRRRGVAELGQQREQRPPAERCRRGRRRRGWSRGRLPRRILSRTPAHERRPARHAATAAAGRPSPAGSRRRPPLGAARRCCRWRARRCTRSRARPARPAVFVVAAVIALILNPLVAAAAARARLPRGLAVAAVYLGLLQRARRPRVPAGQPGGDQVDVVPQGRARARRRRQPLARRPPGVLRRQGHQHPDQGPGRERARRRCRDKRLDGIGRHRVVRRRAAADARRAPASR